MPDDVIGVEDWNWYDWIAYYLDEKTWQRYSRNYHPINDDEMCKYNKVYKVKEIIDWPWLLQYHYEILEERPDI